MTREEPAAGGGNTTRSLAEKNRPPVVSRDSRCSILWGSPLYMPITDRLGLISSWPLMAAARAVL